MQQEGGEPGLVGLLALLPQNCLLFSSSFKSEAVNLRTRQRLSCRPQERLPAARVVRQRLHDHGLGGGGRRLTSPPLSSRQEQSQRWRGSLWRLPRTPRLLRLGTSASCHTLSLEAQGSPSPSVLVCRSSVPGEEGLSGCEFVNIIEVLFGNSLWTPAVA